MSLSSLKIIKHTKWIKYNTSHHQFKYYEHQSRLDCMTGILIDWNIKLSLTTCYCPNLAVFLAAQKHTVYFSFGLCTVVTGIEREKRGGGHLPPQHHWGLRDTFLRCAPVCGMTPVTRQEVLLISQPDLFIYSCVAFLPLDAGMKPAVD